MKFCRCFFCDVFHVLVLCFFDDFWLTFAHLGAPGRPKWVSGGQWRQVSASTIFDGFSGWVQNPEFRRPGLISRVCWAQYHRSQMADLLSATAELQYTADYVFNPRALI